MYQRLRHSVRISIHAPRTGSDDDVSALEAQRPHFNPRSPHGERPRFLSKIRQESSISIHAPRTGSDGFRVEFTHAEQLISIHAPRTGSDQPSVKALRFVRISIHAPRTGSDFTVTTPIDPLH